MSALFSLKVLLWTDETAKRVGLALYKVQDRLNAVYLRFQIDEHFESIREANSELHPTQFCNVKLTDNSN